jgi:hypothetical protein
LTETLRQKRFVIRNVVELVKQKQIQTGLELLKQNGNFIETSSIDAMILDYIKNNGDMIITSRNKDRELINQKTRSVLKEFGKIDKNDHQFTVETEKQMSDRQKCMANSISQVMK